VKLLEYLNSVVIQESCFQGHGVNTHLETITNLITHLRSFSSYCDLKL